MFICIYLHRWVSTLYIKPRSGLNWKTKYLAPKRKIFSLLWNNAGLRSRLWEGPSMFSVAPQFAHGVWQPGFHGVCAHGHRDPAWTGCHVLRMMMSYRRLRLASWTRCHIIVQIKWLQQISYPKQYVTQSSFIPQTSQAPPLHRSSPTQRCWRGSWGKSLLVKHVLCLLWIPALVPFTQDLNELTWPV